METTNNKNIKYDSKDKVLSYIKKLKTESEINKIKNTINIFVTAIKAKHM